MKNQTTPTAPKTTKQKYEKPRIIHSGKIETLAGSCTSTVSCSPNVS